MMNTEKSKTIAYLKTIICLCLLSLMFSSCKETDCKEILFNGKDLKNWDTYLGVPDNRIDIPLFPKNNRNCYDSPVGLNYDPLSVFSVVEVDNEAVIRISGDIYGALITKKEYSDYHLHAEFKWGKTISLQGSGSARNSGICYHSVGDYGVFWTYWMRSYEIEIMEGSLGQFVKVDSAFATVNAINEKLPVRPYKYSPQGEPIKVFDPLYMIHPAGYFEKPYSEWNLIDLYVIKDKSMYFINNNLAMVAEKHGQIINGQDVTVNSGKIQFQSEGAEIFYRNITIENINEFPEL